MTKAPVLHQPDFQKQFIAETDASQLGLGVITRWASRGIFFIKTLTPNMQATPTYNKELFAIVESVHKWRQYLLGRPVIIRTDHKSLRQILRQVIQTPSQQH